MPCLSQPTVAEGSGLFDQEEIPQPAAFWCLRLVNLCWDFAK